LNNRLKLHKTAVASLSATPTLHYITPAFVSCYVIRYYPAVNRRTVFIPVKPSLNKEGNKNLAGIQSNGHTHAFDLICYLGINLKKKKKKKKKLLKTAKFASNDKDLIQQANNRAKGS